MKTNEWISVKDKLPEPGASVIVTAVLGSGQRVVRAATYTTFGFSGNGNFTDVRAWMLMPEPYEEEKWLPDQQRGIDMERLIEPNFWFKAGDSLPVLSKDVLIFDIDGNMRIAHLEENTDGFYFTTDGNDSFNVKYWLPIPDLPPDIQEED